MITREKLLRAGILVASLLVGIPTSTHGQGSGQSPFGGELRGTTQIKGKVVCVDCSLEELRGAQSDSRRLYQVSYGTGQFVMEVTEVNEPQRWSALVSSRKLTARGKASLFQELTAEENLFQEVEILGLLRNTVVFDVYRVKIRRSRPPSIIEQPSGKQEEME